MVKGIIPQVENKVNNKFALMEIVKLVEKTMISKGWNKLKLTRESGASSAAVTRFFQDGMINSENTFKILTSLGLLKGFDNVCDVECDAEIREICRKVKAVRDSDSHWWTSLQQNIDSFKIGADIDSEKGLTSGTQKPAGRTGSRKKAG